MIFQRYLNQINNQCFIIRCQSYSPFTKHNLHSE